MSSHITHHIKILFQNINTFTCMRSACARNRPQKWKDTLKTCRELTLYETERNKWKLKKHTILQYKYICGRISAHMIKKFKTGTKQNASNWSYGHIGYVCLHIMHTCVHARMCTYRIMCPWKVWITSNARKWMEKTEQQKKKKNPNIMLKTLQICIFDTACNVWVFGQTATLLPCRFFSPFNSEFCLFICFSFFFFLVFGVVLISISVEIQQNLPDRCKTTRKLSPQNLSFFSR